jgi:DNA-binding IclR family transcriptional regulator
MSAEAVPSRTTGSQTLARGLTVLQAIAESPDGLTVTEVAALAGVHRTVAYRILNTLAEAGLTHHGRDGRHRGAVGLLSLASAAHRALQSAATDLLVGAAEELGATVALIVRDGDEAVAVRVVSPTRTRYHVHFTEGSRHPLDRGSAGHATLASSPAVPGESEHVARARREGHVCSFGEVEPGMHGVAVPLEAERFGVAGCLNVIATRPRPDAVPVLTAAAEQLAQALHR